MNLERIDSCIDTDQMKDATVAIVGTGGSATLASNLVRSGVEHLRLVDKDTLEPTNLSRQGHEHGDVGYPKVEAVRGMLRRINPDIDVETFHVDILKMSDADIRSAFCDTTLFIFATDNFQAQARGNEIALMLNAPAVWIGLYAGGLGGEVAFWHPDLDSCFRCLTAKRYEAQERAKQEGRSLDPPSDGADIFSIQFLDAIAGQIAVGLITRGSDNRFGRLIDGLGDRNFIQTQIDPDFVTGGRAVVREQLGIAEDSDAFFSWNTIARRDPDCGNLPCPDCKRFRHVEFVPDQDGWRRVKRPLDLQFASEPEGLEPEAGVSPIAI